MTEHVHVFRIHGKTIVRGQCNTRTGSGRRSLLPYVHVETRCACGARQVTPIGRPVRSSR